MEIQTFMEGHPYYQTSDSTEVTLQHAAVFVPVSTYTHQPFIHKYCDFCYWWTSVACHLTDQVKSERILKKLETHMLCSLKICIAFDKPRTYEVN